MTRLGLKRFLPVRWPGLALLAWVLALHACGGGVEGQGTGSFSYVQGSISGFGSIFVNGVEFIDDSATITDEDDKPLSAADLKLGMTVSVEAGAIDEATASAQASVVKVYRALVGPVAALDATQGVLTVLGQTVRVGTVTVFDDTLAAGLASLRVGDAVQVHALFDEVAGVYVARRVAPAVSGAGLWVSGPVSSLDLAARSFELAGQRYVDPSGALLSAWANGQSVRVRVLAAPDALGRWVVAAGSPSGRSAPNGAGVKLEGLIGPDLAAARFKLDGIAVDASRATVEPTGRALARGLRVEVQGQMSAGTLQASRVLVKARDDQGEDEQGQSTEFEIKGSIDSVDVATASFRVRGATLHWRSSTRFNNGSSSSLVPGAKVEVKGWLTRTGTAVEAVEITFK